MPIKKSGSWDKKRKVRKIPEGRNIKFYYCGECTEPEYFGFVSNIIKQKKDKESKGITRFNYYEKVIPVDPKKMVKSVEDDIKNLSIHLDEVYVVFDKDSFKDDNFDNAVMMVHILEEKYQDIKFIPLWSNECLELWFVLHFEFLQSQIKRSSYFKKLQKYLKIPKYEKNMKDLYQLIERNGGSVNSAIDNAHKLLVMHESKNSFSDKNPATNVVEFFDIYKKYIN